MAATENSSTVQPALLFERINDAVTTGRRLFASVESIGLQNAAKRDAVDTSDLCAEGLATIASRGIDVLGDAEEALAELHNNVPGAACPPSAERHSPPDLLRVRLALEEVEMHMRFANDLLGEVWDHGELHDCALGGAEALLEKARVGLQDLYASIPPGNAMYPSAPVEELEA